MRRHLLVFAAAVLFGLTLGTVAHAVAMALADDRPHEPVPYSTDRATAQETWETIQRGRDAVPAQH